MNREEATTLLREVSVACNGLGEKGIMLMPPNADDVLSHGYQIHIRTEAHDRVVACIRPVVEQHNLVLAHEPEKGLIIIYRPLTQKRG